MSDGIDTVRGEQSEGTVTGWVDALTSKVRFGMFLSVGIIGALFDTAVLVIAVEVFGLLEEIALLLGIETAIVVMFLLNDRFTFKHAGASGRWSVLFRLARSHGVRAGGIVTQFVVFVLVYRLFFVSVPVMGVDGWLLVAKGLGISAGFFVNYVFESLFTWKVQAK